MIVVDNKFELTQIVYLKTDPSQCRRVVTGIMQIPSGILYQLSQGSACSLHYDFEISEAEDILTKTE